MTTKQKQSKQKSLLITLAITLLILSAVTLFSCQKQIVRPQLTSNAVTHLKEILWAINDDWFISCSNEYVHVEGNIVYTVTRNIVGDVIHSTVEFHYANVKGIGLTTGNKYVFTGHATDNLTAHLEGQIWVVDHQNITNKLVTTTPGKGNNSVTTITYHITSDEYGNLVVDHSKFENNVCK